MSDFQDAKGRPHPDRGKRAEEANAKGAAPGAATTSGERPSSISEVMARRAAPMDAFLAREARRVQLKQERESKEAAQAQIPKGAGAPLAADVRARLEPAIGADLSGARIHTGSQSAAAAQNFGAKAFAVGQDVHFGAGQFDPHSKEGTRLLAHELAHTVQAQNSGVQRKPDDGEHAKEGGGHEVSHPDEPAEKEADAIGDHAAEQLHGDGSKKAPGAKGVEPARPSQPSSTASAAKCSLPPMTRAKRTPPSSGSAKAVKMPVRSGMR